MKKQIVILFAILTLVSMVACTQPSAPGDSPDGVEGEGRAVFTITDAAADMGAVSEVRVTVDSVRVHSEAQGWVEVSDTAQTYDLLELKAEGQLALLADAELAADTYNQLRLDISEVVVVDNEGEHEAKLPSNELRLQGELVVEEGATATATFDFIADESLHVTGEGTYILAPVVQVETRSNAQVDVASNNRVEVNGGNVRTNVRVGMDAEGNVGVGVRIPANAQLNVNALGKIGVGSQGGVDIGVGGRGSANSDSQEDDSSADAEANGSAGVGVGVY